MTRITLISALAIYVCSLTIQALDLSHPNIGNRRRLAIAPGFWSTDGGKIVDDNGTELYFSGLNWGGFDSQNCVVDGLWTGTGRTIESHIQQMAALGFNIIRLAFAGTCVQPNVYPKLYSVDYTLNTDIVNLTSLEVMDKVVKYAGDWGVRIILDYHRIHPTDNSGDFEDGLWYTNNTSEDVWIDNWKLVAKRFANNPTVVGADLFNEPHNNTATHRGPFWYDNDNDKVNWKRAVKKAADAIQEIEPRWLIFVQGMWQTAWWGANLTLMKDSPLNLTVPQKLVYQIHDYGPWVNPQPWFNVEGFPNNLEAFWNSTWGYVQLEGIAPVWIGEFGTIHNTTASNDSSNALEYKNWQELQWFNALVAYIQKYKFSWTYFTWGPNSRDTGGILMDNWLTVHEDKIAVLSAIEYPSFSLIPNGTSSGNLPPLSLAPIDPSTPPPPADNLLNPGTTPGQAGGAAQLVYPSVYFVGVMVLGAMML